MMSQSLFFTSALADEAGSAGVSDTPAEVTNPTEPAGGSGATGASSPSEPQKHYINKVAIYQDGVLGAITVGGTAEAEITQLGGFLQFTTGVLWTDGSDNQGTTEYISWSSSDLNVATVTSSGLVRAVHDGAATIRATVSPSYTENGSEVYAEINLLVTGQGDTAYVTGLRITDAQGNEMGDQAFVVDLSEESLTTYAAQFYCNVDVYDALSGTTQTYWTGNGPLSQQVPSLSDVQWECDSSMGAMEDSLPGRFRPTCSGNQQITAYINAGLGATRVWSVLNVSVVEPESDNPDRHPQETLTLKIYYQNDVTNLGYDPMAFDPNHPPEGFEFAEKTYTVADLEALGVQIATYTALSGAGDYYTITGRGPLLSAVLEDAGVNVNGVYKFDFGTYDNLLRPVSADFVFSARYWFKSADIGNFYSDMEQVFPMIAIDSRQVRNGDSSAVDYDLSDSTRFRLLFGALSPTYDSGGSLQIIANSLYQIKWINTLYVMLEGGRPAGEPDPGPNPGTDLNGGGSGEGGGSGDGSGSGVGAVGDGEGGNAGEGSSEGEAGGPESGEDAGDAGAGALGSARAGTDIKVFQIANRDASNIADTTNYVNPFKPFVLPAAGTLFVAGGLESAAWFRRQRRAVARVGDASGQ